MFSDSDIYTANVVAHSGSIRAAAKKLHKSQPAISHAVLRLEEKLGFKLFDRSGYRISLTPQGRDFLQRSEGLLSMEAQLQDYAEVIRKGQESTLAIALWPMVDRSLISTVFHEISRDYPQTRLHIRYVESLGGQNLLLNQAVDIAIHPGRNTDDEQSVESQTIEQMTLVNVIAPTLLAQKPESRSLREQLLHWNRAVMQDNASDKSYGVGIHQGGKQWVVNDQRILSTLIYEGLAWGMLPEPVVNNSLKSGELIKLDVPEFGSDLSVDIMVSRLKNHPCGPVASACWQGFTGTN